MKAEKMIQWGLFAFLVVSPASILAQVSTGYDGAGNYIEDAAIDEKENRKLTIDRLQSKRQKIIKRAQRTIKTICIIIT